MAIDDFWTQKKNFWNKYTLERIKDEYIPIRLAYDNMPVKPKVIKERLIMLERKVPAEELKNWEEQISISPKRGEKKQWEHEGGETALFKKYEKTGEWPIPYTPFNKIKRYGPSTSDWYRRSYPDEPTKKETIAKRILSILNEARYMNYKKLMVLLGYGHEGEMNTDIVLRRMENSGLITRVAKGDYRITLKGKEAWRELESNTEYYPFKGD
jgi:hypothetical protein